jgi:spore maturation protein A
MGVLAAAVRGILNINFIWAALLLGGLALCALQHYLPTTVVVERDALANGPQTLVLTLEPTNVGDDEPTPRYELEVAADALARAGADEPWLTLVKSSTAPKPQPSDAEPGEEAAVAVERDPFWFRPAAVSDEALAFQWDYPAAGDWTLHRVSTTDEVVLSGEHTTATTAAIPLETVGDTAQTFVLELTRTNGADAGPPLRYEFEIKANPAERAAAGDRWVGPRSIADTVKDPDRQATGADLLRFGAAGVTDDTLQVQWFYPFPAEWRLYRVESETKRIARGELITLQSFTDAAFDYAEIGFQIALGLVAAMVLFLGLMKVGEQAGIVQLVSRGIYPLIRFLFPDVPKDHPANGAILMNWTTTLLGLGNAATPFGLKAMKELQSLNPNKEIATDSQVMLLGYNTAGLALLPTTLIAVRKSVGVADPFAIIGTCMFAGFVSTVVAIIAVKLLGALPIFSMQAAVADDLTTAGATPPDAAGDDDRGKEG